MLLRGGETPVDKSLSLFDVSATFNQAPFDSIVVGYTRELETNLRMLRLRGALPVARQVDAEPFIRFRDARLWDLGVEVRVRM